MMRRIASASCALASSSSESSRPRSAKTLPLPRTNSSFFFTFRSCGLSRVFTGIKSFVMSLGALQSFIDRVDYLLRGRNARSRLFLIGMQHVHGLLEFGGKDDTVGIAVVAFDNLQNFASLRAFELRDVAGCFS